jgi:tRNA A37 N6-isopentenylltransferase MiaA
VLIKKQTRRFVHQQQTWFRADDPAIHWLEPGREPLAEIFVMLDAWQRHDSRA